MLFLFWKVAIFLKVWSFFGVKPEKFTWHNKSCWVLKVVSFDSLHWMRGFLWRKPVDFCRSSAGYHPRNWPLGNSLIGSVAGDTLLTRPYLANWIGLIPTPKNICPKKKSEVEFVAKNSLDQLSKKGQTVDGSEFRRSPVEISFTPEWIMRSLPFQLVHQTSERLNSHKIWKYSTHLDHWFPSNIFESKQKANVNKDDPAQTPTLEMLKLSSDL